MTGDWEKLPNLEFGQGETPSWNGYFLEGTDHDLFRAAPNVAWFNVLHVVFFFFPSLNMCWMVKQTKQDQPSDRV